MQPAPFRRLSDCLDRHDLTAEASDICACFGVTIEAVEGARRTHNVTFARHRLMLLLRDKTGMSFPEIGRVFGNRDHSTVVYALAALRPFFLPETTEPSSLRGISSRERCA